MSPTPLENAAIPTHNTVFARLYYGELSLPVTFWVFGFLLTLLHYVGILYLEYYTDSPAFEAFASKNPILTSCMFIALILYLCGWTYVVLVGQWRAARKYKGRKIWAFLVKMSVAMSSFNIVIGLFDFKTLVALIILFHT